jgi:hypothetical protein
VQTVARRRGAGGGESQDQKKQSLQTASDGCVYGVDWLVGASVDTRGLPLDRPPGCQGPPAADACNGGFRLGGFGGGAAGGDPPPWPHLQVALRSADLTLMLRAAGKAARRRFPLSVHEQGGRAPQSNHVRSCVRTPTTTPFGGAHSALEPR